MQAARNANVANESWAAMPEEVVQGMRSAPLDRFREAGVGLIAVGERARMVVPCVASDRSPERFRAAAWCWHLKAAREGGA